MTILDIFHLQSGYTVFAGPIEDGNKVIRNCKVELLIDGSPLQTVEISGELLMDVKHPEGYRAISTKQRLDLSPAFLQQHLCQLKEVIAV